MKTIFLIMLTGLLMGCASSRVLTGKAHPAISPENVRIYQEMPAGAEEVGLVSAQNAWNFNQEHVVSGMKKQAAKMGANGIVISTAKTSAWTGVSGQGKAIFVDDVKAK